MRLSWSSALGLTALACVQAKAQTTSSPANSDSSILEEIVVTGSRAIRNGAQTPTPVTVVSVDELQAGAPGTIAQGLNQLPVFQGSTNAASGQLSATGPNSGSFLNLRNLGAQRTLLLLDGRRTAPSTITGTTDTNTLPQELVKRVDVVTGGASAAYGSDAVAGVVNFVLDTRLTGIKASAEGSLTTYGDNGTQKYSLTGGDSFAGGRGHIVVSGSYYDSDGVKSVRDRPFGRDANVVVTNPANPTESIMVGNYSSSFFADGGLIYGGTGLGMGTQQFAADGSVVPFNAGTIVDGELVGGQGSVASQTLLAAVRSKSLFSHAEYEVTPELTAFVEGSYASVHNRYRQTENFHIPGFNAPTILLGNPYIPAALQATMIANGQVGFQLGRLNLDMPASVADATNQTYNAVTGFNYEFAPDWELDAYYQYGSNRQRIKTENNLNYARFFAAVDAVRDPTTGNTVCRVTLTNPGRYPGCVPLNLIGSGSPSDEAIAYVQGTAYYKADVSRQVAAMTVRGTPFELPAGDVSFAAGFEYRREEVKQVSDEIAQTPVSSVGLRLVPAQVLASPGGWQLTNIQPISGSYDIREVFSEVDVPLLRDLPLAHSLSANAAIRYTDYSTSGGVTTWKVGSVWQPVESVTLRGTVSRDIRAPNISELYSPAVQASLTTVKDTLNNVSANVLVSEVGNPDLQPEETDTYTTGIVFRAGENKNFTASVDYYNIDVSNVISRYTGQRTIDLCAASDGTGSICSNLIYSNPTARTGLIRIITPQLNLSALKTSGLDFEVGYNTDLSDWSSVLEGTLSLRGLATYLIDYTRIEPGAEPIDATGVVGGIYSNPRLSAKLSATYTKGDFTLFLQERFIGSGKFQAGTEVYNPALADNHVSAVAYTDISARQAFDMGGGKVEFFATVNNLFNKQPPALPFGTFNVVYPTNPQLYDILGRNFTAGFRAVF